jgi:hypothetical protein
MAPPESGEDQDADRAGSAEVCPQPSLKEVKPMENKKSTEAKGDAIMKKEDFERITHITMALGFIPYTQLICSLHMDLAVELEEHEEREREIYLEYPEYYDDEEIYEKYDKWIEDFCSQIPEDRQEYYRTLIKENKQEY